MLKSQTPEVTSEKLETKYPSFYSAFKVTVTLNKFEQVLNPNLWLSVTRFFSRQENRQQTEVTNSINQEKTSELKIFVVNIKSLRIKLVELEAYITDKNYHLMGITEHWLSSPEADMTSIVNIQTRLHFSRQRFKHGG